MLAQARQLPELRIEYRLYVSHVTGLPDGCVDIVAASQALHWMDPFPTFQEARRILRPGRVMAAFDYDWPPCVMDAAC
jgi:SAM-dependent methyltransferase